MRPALLAIIALLTACAGPTVGDYAANRPLLDPGRFFLGKTEAWGMFQDRQGRLVKRFTVAMDGERRGDEVVLNERFQYSDGTRQQRVWRLQPLGGGRWRGQAADVVGEAQGEAAGNALRWRYTLRLPVDGKEYDVQFDDWMFLQDDNSLLNRATMSKFGFPLGEVTLFFRKPESAP